MSNPLNEMERRWDDFQGGLSVSLPNGEIWQFYQPQAVKRGNKVGWTFGTEVADDVDQVLSYRFTKILAKWDRAKNDMDRTSVMLEAAWFLLARNYAVTQQEFESLILLSQVWNEEQQCQLMTDLMLVVSVTVYRARALSEVA